MLRAGAAEPAAGRRICPFESFAGMLSAVLHRGRFPLLAIGLAGSGCDPEPTYTREVAPILAAQCAGCHREGGVAPMALETYEDARQHAAAIADAVESRRMPPWPARQDGDCPSLDGDRSLSADEISVLSSWTQAGAPRGNGSRETATPPTEARWLDRVSVTVAPAEPFVPDPATDSYRCFILDPALATDQYLLAYGVGAAQGVHHLHLWSIDDEAELAKAEALDAADPGGGWSCIENAGIIARHLTVWGPTDPVRRHPEGTGMLLRAQKKLLMQIHYHHATESGTFLALDLADQVALPADILTIGPPPFVLPAREAATTIQALTVASQDALLWGVRAHMHDLGSRARISLVRDGQEACLLSIPEWDARWQLMYFFEEPIAVKTGDTLQIDCTYDTTSKTEDTLSGPTASDEMCNANFYLTP